MTTSSTPLTPASLPTASAAPGPLSEKHLAQLAAARTDRKKIDRAIAVCGFSAYSTATFAALSLPFAFFSVVGFVMTAGLTIVAYHEFKGRALLRALDERGPRLLGWNQVGFAVLLIAYAAWSMYAAITGPSPYAEQMADPAMQEMLGPIADLMRNLAIAVYGVVAVGALLCQGGTALYYFSRGSLLRAYRARTPDWIVELQRRSAA